MSNPEQENLFQISSSVFNKEEIILHQAAQIIALTGTNVQAPLPDESQNTLVYDSSKRMLLGRSFRLSDHDYSTGIALPSFELVLLDENLLIINRISLEGKKKSSVLSQWSDWLVDVGFSEHINLKLNYVLPTTSAYEADNYGSLSNEFVNSWHKVRSMANISLKNLNNLVDFESEVNIWPHHFDTGVYYPLKTVDNEVVASVGAGLAIADSMTNEPYFYIYGYKKNTDINYKHVPALNAGYWLTDDWQGAVLPVSELTDTEASSQIDMFFKQSYKFLVAQL